MRSEQAGFNVLGNKKLLENSEKSLADITVIDYRNETNRAKAVVPMGSGVVFHPMHLFILILVNDRRQNHVYSIFTERSS